MTILDFCSVRYSQPSIGHRSLLDKKKTRQLKTITTHNETKRTRHRQSRGSWHDVKYPSSG